LVFTLYPLGFSGFTGFFRCLSEFFPELGRLIGFEIAIVLNILPQQFYFQLMGVNFTALAQAQLLDMLENQLVFFLVIALEGDN